MEGGASTIVSIKLSRDWLPLPQLYEMSDDIGEAVPTTGMGVDKGATGIGVGNGVGSAVAAMSTNEN